MYTMQDYNEAIAELSRLMDRYTNCAVENPNKDPDSVLFTIDVAHRETNAIEDYLRSTGVIKMNDAELLKYNLDTIFPKVRHNQIVRFLGKQYQRKWRAGTTNAAGGVKKWISSWIEVN